MSTAKFSRGLSLTGSVGVLLKAKRLSYDVSIPQALQRIWLSEPVVRFALTQC